MRMALNKRMALNNQQILLKIMWQSCSSKSVAKSSTNAKFGSNC